MPTVPTLGNPVQQQALPSPRIDVGAPIEAFGGGPALGRATEAVQSAARATYDFYKDQKKQADDIVVQDKLAAATRRQTELLYNPENGAYWKKGKNAFDLVESHYTPYQAYLKELAKDLDQDQLSLFQRQASRLDTETYQGLIKHIGVQTGDYDEESTKNYLEVSLQKGINNRNVVGEDRRQMEAIVKSVRGNADRMGITDTAYIERQVQKYQNEMYAGRVKAWLADDQPEYAEQELLRHGEKIDSPEREALQEEVKKSRGEKEGRRLGEDLFNKYTDPQDALAEARKQEDKRTREAAVDRLEELVKEQKTRRETTDDKIHQELSNLVISSRGTAELPYSKLRQLPPEKQSALMAFRDRVRQDRDDEQDNGKWSKMMEAAKAGSLSKLSRADFDAQYWNHFDKEHRRKADSLWLEAKKDKPGPAFKSALSQDDMIRDGMVSSGLIKANVKNGDLSDEQARRKGLIEQELDRKLEAYFHSTGKNAGDDVKKQYIREIIENRVLIKKGWGPLDFLVKDEELPAAVASEDERARAYTPFDQIPEARRRSLLNIARSRAVPGVDWSKSDDEAAAAAIKDRIEKAYAAMLAGVRDDAALMKILRGED